MAKIRQSNFECMRIFAMFLINVHHVAGNCPWPEGDAVKDIVLLIMQFGGKLGVDLFVLITGYMSINSRFKIRSLLRVVLQTWFYSIAILLLFFVFDRGGIDSSRGVLKSLVPTTSCLYWFVTFYVGVVLISPFLNALVAGLGRDGTKKLLIVLFILLSAIPTFMRLTFVMNNLTWFSFLYILAGYIRLWGSAWDRRKILFCTCVPTAVVIVVGTVASLLTGSRWHPLATAESSFMVVAAIGCFKWFAQLDLGSNRIINAIASGSFANYLISTNWLSGGWLWTHLTFVYEAEPLMLLVAGSGVSIGVYLFCVAVDLVRQRLIEAPVIHFTERGWIGHLLDQYDSWINTVNPV